MGDGCGLNTDGERFDGDGLADPAMVVNNNWTVWFSLGGYLPQGPFQFVP